MKSNDTEETVFHTNDDAFVKDHRNFGRLTVEGNTLHLVSAKGKEEKFEPRVIVRIPGNIIDKEGETYLQSRTCLTSTRANSRLYLFKAKELVRQNDGIRPEKRQVSKGTRKAAKSRSA